MTGRRFFRLGAALVACSVVMSGCMFGGADDDNKKESGADSTTLTGELEVVSFYPAGSPDYQRLQALGKEFEKRHPGVTVKFVFGGGQDTPKIQARWRAGNPPEVNYGFFGPTANAGDGLTYVHAGQVYSLDDAMKKPLASYGKPWKEAILPAVRSQITSSEDGKVYAAPEAVTTIQFFYNKKIFDQQGLQPPKTLDDLFAAADKLKAAGVTPFTVTGTFPPYMQLWMDYLLLRRAGAQNVQDAIAGKKDFASLPGVNEAAADLQRLTHSGYFLDGFRSTDFTAAQLAFFQGKAAMILMGSWLVGEMKASIPADFQTGTFAFPTIPGAAGDQDGIFGGVNAQTVASQSKNPALGVEWLRFVAEKDNQNKYVEQTGNISAYEGVPAPPGFENQAALLSKENSFVQSYFAVLSQPAAVKDAYEQPIVKMFFGQLDAAGLVKQINDGLKKARG